MRLRRFVTSLCLCALLVPAQGRSASAEENSRVTGDAAAREISRIAQEWWDMEMAAHPMWATAIGVTDYDGRLSDITPEGVEAHRAQIRNLGRRVARIDPLDLDRQEQVTLDLLDHQIRSHLSEAGCEWRFWSVNQMWGPQVRFLSLLEIQTIPNGRGARDYLNRLQAIPAWIDQHIENLRRGMGLGFVAYHVPVDRVIAQIEDIASRDISDSPLLPSHGQLPAQWTSTRRKRYRIKVREVLHEEVRPALEKYRRFLERELRPKARRQPGINALPVGSFCYQQLIHQHVTIPLTAQEIHNIGLAEVEAIHDEMEPLVEDLFPGLTVRQALDKLRSDPEMAFTTREAIVAKARAAVERAWEELPTAFHARPRARVIVKPVEPHAEKHSPMAYYRGPAPDGSRPGTYYVNTYRPEARPRYTAEVLAFHEAVPGHHLQIAVAQELEDIPSFRKHAGVTAFVEGWALYSELLSEEMGLYSGDLDRLGMLSFEAWRAARLVVDTGIHSMAWDRERAIEYLKATTAASLPNIENEVDRYIVSPGQALAYKMGQLEILRLRAWARGELGNEFDIRDFHHRALRNGAVPLRVLKEEIELYVTEVLRAREASQTQAQN